jgi:hypothetical protein
MMRLLPIALLLATPCAAATMPSPNWPAPADRGDVLLRQAVLSSHNTARAQFGVAPMGWSDQLAADALGYARQMVTTGTYGHDQTPGRRKTSGENLWRGQRGVFSYDVMVGGMVEEARYFRPGVFPDNSRTGEWHDVGHYTQIVWPATTQVGCALASSATTDYLVCRYSPAGNRDGVLLASGRDPLAALPAGQQLAANRGD